MLCLYLIHTLKKMNEFTKFWGQAIKSLMV